LKSGGKNFVLNSPFQSAFFEHPKRLNLWAGPFCNISNPLSLETVKNMGFKGAFISPELGRDEILKLPEKSPIPLGIVIKGAWPLCISRTFSEKLELGKPIVSPKGEEAWAQKYGSTLWLYPNWKLDISSSRKDLIKAGYALFVIISEPIPKGVRLKNRPGLWNRDLGLL
jgi:putative protease